MVMRVASSTYISQAAWRSASSGAHLATDLAEERQGQLDVDLLQAGHRLLQARRLLGSDMSQRRVMGQDLRMTVVPPAASTPAVAGGGDRRDFFVSYAGPDRPWARWVAALLAAAGFRGGTRTSPAGIGCSRSYTPGFAVLPRWWSRRCMGWVGSARRSWRWSTPTGSRRTTNIMLGVMSPRIHLRTRSTSSAANAAVRTPPTATTHAVVV